MKVKGEVTLQTMIVKLENYRKIFEDICLKCNGVCVADQVKIHYPVRNGDGSATIRTIVKDAFLADSLKTFYVECEPHSKIVVELPTSTHRAARANEVLYNYITTTNFTVDVRFYEFLEEYPDYCESYLTKRKYLNLIIGRECLNWINPAYFVCHLMECKELFKIGSFGNILKVISHQPSAFL